MLKKNSSVISVLRKKKKMNKNSRKIFVERKMLLWQNVEIDYNFAISRVLNVVSTYANVPFKLFMNTERTRYDVRPL